MEDQLSKTAPLDTIYFVPADLVAKLSDWERLNDREKAELNAEIESAARLGRIGKMINLL